MGILTGRAWISDSDTTQGHYFIWQILPILNSDCFEWRKAAQRSTPIQFDVSRNSHISVQCIAVNTVVCFFFWWLCGPMRAMVSSFLRLLDHHTQQRTTVGRTPLDEWSARRTDLFLTTHNTHNRQTSMLPVGFEPTISAGERTQTYALDSVATGTGMLQL